MYMYDEIIVQVLLGLVGVLSEKKIVKKRKCIVDIVTQLHQKKRYCY